MLKISQLLGIFLTFSCMVNGMEMPIEQRGTKRPAEEPSSEPTEKKAKIDLVTLVGMGGEEVKVPLVIASLSATLKGAIDLSQEQGADKSNIRIPLEGIARDVLKVLFDLVIFCTDLKTGITYLEKFKLAAPNPTLVKLYLMYGSKFNILGNIIANVKSVLNGFNDPQRDGKQKPYFFVDLLKACNYLDIPVIVPIVAGLAALEIHKRKLTAQQIQELALSGLHDIYYEVAKQYYILFRYRTPIGEATMNEERSVNRTKVQNFLNEAFGDGWGLTIQEAQKYHLVSGEDVGLGRLWGLGLGSLQGVTAEMVGNNLNLKDNNFTYITQKDFAGLKSATKIDLSNNPLMGIDDDTFNGFNQLESLNLSRTLFTSIARGDELKLPSKYNINSAVFAPISGSLKTLFLENNQLEIIGDSLFNNIGAGTALFFRQGQEPLVISKPYPYMASNVYDDTSNNIQLRRMVEAVKKASRGAEKYFCYFFLKPRLF